MNARSAQKFKHKKAEEHSKATLQKSKSSFFNKHAFFVMSNFGFEFQRNRSWSKIATFFEQTRKRIFLLQYKNRQISNESRQHKKRLECTKNNRSKFCPNSVLSRLWTLSRTSIIPPLSGEASILAYFRKFSPNCLAKVRYACFSGHKEHFAPELFEEQIALIFLWLTSPAKLGHIFATSVPDKTPKHLLCFCRQSC